IPLGGYVKMLGEHSLEERDGDTPLPADELAQSHDRQPVWKRMAISFAGPAANLILCVMLLWAMFVIGRPDYAPVIGKVDGIAAAAGLGSGDTLLTVGTRETPTWKEAELALLGAALDRRDIPLHVRTRDGEETVHQLRASQLPKVFDERETFVLLGIKPRYLLAPAVIGRVSPDGPAWGVLAEGDRITAIDGEPVLSFDDLPALVRRLGEQGAEAMVEVQRGEDRLALPMKPRQLTTPEGKSYWGLGIAMAQSKLPPKDAVLRYGPIAAVPAAIGEATHQANELVAMIRRAFAGSVSVRNTVAGPITIARASNAMASEGLATYLWLLALLSLSLGILNLLPIPILDGGHLLYYLIELVKGSPVSERVMAAGNFVGLALIAGLMGLAFYNDIVNNLVH
ncbi:MAG TPA: RIP metalloprotease RseP, partial [Lysobacter sp.]|nr:RIP metalloprotease RseP [Lysobacter sp.]